MQPAKQAQISWGTLVLEHTNPLVSSREGVVQLGKVWQPSTFKSLQGSHIVHNGPFVASMA